MSHYFVCIQSLLKYLIECLWISFPFFFLIPTFSLHVNILLKGWSIVSIVGTAIIFQPFKSRSSHLFNGCDGQMKPNLYDWVQLPHKVSRIAKVQHGTWSFLIFVHKEKQLVFPHARQGRFIWIMYFVLMISSWSRVDLFIYINI